MYQNIFDSHAHYNGKDFEDRDELLKEDPLLQNPEHAAFKERLLELYQKNWKLIDLS